MIINSMNLNLFIPQDIQDEIDALIIATTLIGYDVSCELHHNQATLNFAQIIHYFKNDKDVWMLCLSFQIESLYLLSLRKEKTNLCVSSRDVNEDLMLPIKIAKMII